jgi:OOP family OmpA-OmpF porin
MDKRILAVLIAAMTGTAYAQSNGAANGYVANSGGSPVMNSAGSRVTNSAAATGATAAAPRAQVAQSSTYGASSSSRSARSSAAGASATTATGPAPGYLQNSAGSPVVNSAEHCVHTSTWNPALAAEPCDTVPRASVPAVPVAEAPAPEPAPVAQAAPETPPNVIEKVTLNTDVLFAFNKAELLPGGKDKLNELAKDAQGAQVDRVVLAGYADRIGSEDYNKDLSERRAQAVAEYLASQGVDQSRIQVEGRGEENPITGDTCKRMGPEKASNRKLVSCLQPDRRVEAELLGSREVAGTGAAPATGATGTTGTGTSGASGGGSSP